MADSEEKGLPTKGEIGATEDVQDAQGVVPAYSTGFNLFGITFAFCLAILLGALDQAIIVTAAPRITDLFNSLLDIG